MKKQLFIIASLISSISFGQSLTQANEPAIGQSIQMYVCDTTVGNLASVMGNNVTWDYSNIVSDGGATSLINIVSAAQTTNGAFFKIQQKRFLFKVLC